jgi:hypothetical protein
MEEFEEEEKEAELVPEETNFEDDLDGLDLD